ncbi:hypothetical protein PCASD_21194 [Puccinia coronata f. sp. avenae]|uniref:Uncharacterized protein n=1 Tax=Puccinia coronata f. sp. avenae TaxID=200324 RepID=A0A2N5TWI2_9BASI|nr:hypothetical protein PCASD_21194 [Puccinia coronata f. sp. avenae]
MPWSRVDKAGKQGETWETTRGGGPGLELLRYAGHPERDVPTTRPPHSWRPFFGVMQKPLRVPGSSALPHRCAQLTGNFPLRATYIPTILGLQRKLSRRATQSTYQARRHDPQTRNPALKDLDLPCIRLGKQTQCNQGTALIVGFPSRSSDTLGCDLFNSVSLGPILVVLGGYTGLKISNLRTLAFAPLTQERVPKTLLLLLSQTDLFALIFPAREHHPLTL